VKHGHLAVLEVSRGFLLQESAKVTPSRMCRRTSVLRCS